MSPSTKTTSKKPKIVWGNGVTSTGVWFTSPRKFKYDSETESWWDEAGFWEIPAVGTTVKNSSVVTFACAAQATAIAWTAGAWSVMQLLHNWSKFR